MNRIIIAACVVTILTGCATGSKLTPEQKSLANEPLLCSTKQDCDFMWQRAQSWVANNSHFRIQVATDTLIQTFGPSADAYFAFTITKELNREGGARIMIAPQCGNMFGCVTDPWDLIYSFKQSLKQ